VNVELVTYFGYPGEPALGPRPSCTASLLRESSCSIGASLQDSTHISFWRLDHGTHYRWFKLEGSIFNGREPGTRTLQLRSAYWNSRSARFTFAPNNQLDYPGQLRFCASLKRLSQLPTFARYRFYSIQQTDYRGKLGHEFNLGRNHTSRPGDLHNPMGTQPINRKLPQQNYLYTRLD